MKKLINRAGIEVHYERVDGILMNEGKTLNKLLSKTTTNDSDFFLRFNVNDNISENYEVTGVYYHNRSGDGRSVYDLLEVVKKNPLIASIHIEDFMNWFFNGASDKENKEVLMNLGREVKDGLLWGGDKFITITVESIFEEIDKGCIPANLFKEFSECNCDEIGEYRIDEYKLIY